MNTFEHDDMMKKKKLNNTCSLLIMLLVYLHFTCKQIGQRIDFSSKNLHKLTEWHTNN